jgi:hypothetical protein
MGLFDYWRHRSKALKVFVLRWIHLFQIEKLSLLLLKFIELFDAHQVLLVCQGVLVDPLLFFLLL